MFLLVMMHYQYLSSNNESHYGQLCTVYLPFPTVVPCPYHLGEFKSFLYYFHVGNHGRHFLCKEEIKYADKYTCRH